MTKPTVADNKPVGVELEKGKEYYFCTCGQSASQPYCDGAHQGSSFAPKPFIADKTGTAYLCACKHTTNAPFCDGKHTTV
jgi:CDGSH-type Zn-finger protein